MANGREYKRKYDRLYAPFLLRVLTYNHSKLDAEYCTCAIGTNISPGGLSFKYPSVIEEGDHLKLLIQDLSGMRCEDVLAHVRVVWAESKDVLSKRYGCRFVKLKPDKKYKILKLIRNNEKERIGRRMRNGW